MTSLHTPPDHAAGHAVGPTVNPAGSPHRAGDRLLFTPTLAVVGHFPATATIEQLAEETGVYSASPAFVRAHCGPLANTILDTVPAAFHTTAVEQGLYVNIDVRIHRLYRGDFPAYPGWHCDGEYRATFDAQPDLTRIAPHTHLVGCISTDPDGVSTTQFAAADSTVVLTHDPTPEHTLWGQVHAATERDQVPRTDSRDGHLHEFSSATLHRAMPARVRGWRLFFRASMWHKPYLGDQGRISRSEQVYQLVEGAGW